MTHTDTVPAPAVADLPGGPYDLEFFFDPGCPFAWQTSVWIRRVAELKGISVGWRFISLKFINEGQDQSPERAKASERGLRFHRITAAARERLGNDAVGALYRAYGEAYWYTSAEGEWDVRAAEAADRVDPAKLIADLGLPADLADAADYDSYDALIRAESEEAFRRTGEDVGTPIITFTSSQNSLFGPVISSIPDDDLAVQFYDALRVFVDFGAFSELKRTKRAPLDLPLLQD